MASITLQAKNADDDDIELKLTLEPKAMGSIALSNQATGDSSIHELKSVSKVRDGSRLSGLETLGAAGRWVLLELVLTDEPATIRLTRRSGGTAEVTELTALLTDAQEFQASVSTQAGPFIGRSLRDATNGSFWQAGLREFSQLWPDLQDALQQPWWRSGAKSAVYRGYPRFRMRLVGDDKKELFISLPIDTEG